MKSLIKKIAVFVFALVVMVRTASTVLAGSTGNYNPGPEWDTPLEWGMVGQTPTIR